MSSENLKILEQVNKIEEILFSDGETAMSWLKELLDLSIRENDAFGLYKSHNMLGILNSDMGKSEEALNHFAIAMTYTVFDAIKREKPVLLNNIGTVLVSIGNYFDAIENFTAALAMIYELGIREDLIFAIHLNIAEAYLYIDKPDEAIRNIDEVKERLDRENTEDVAVMLGTLAHAYISKAEAEKAYELILKCEEAAQLSSYASVINLVNYYKALYFELIEDMNAADYFYKKVLMPQLKGESYYFFNQVALDYINFLMRLNALSEAKQFITEAISLAKEKHWNWVILDYYRLLAQVSNATLDWEGALSAMNLYFEIEQENRKKRDQMNYNCFKIQEKVLSMNMSNRHLTDAVERLKAVNNMLKQLNAFDHMDLTIETLYGSLKSLFKIDTFALGLYNDDLRQIEYVAKYENGISMGHSVVSYDQHKSFSAYVRNKGVPVIIHNIDDFESVRNAYPTVKLVEADISHDGNHSKSIVIWPMQFEGREIGLINCQAINANTFSTFDIELIEMLASHLAIAIENHRQKSVLNQAISRLNRMSYTDSLTDVYNRQALNEFVPKLYEKSIMEHSHVVFAMVDLDNFKNLNDQYGHQQGDQCLMAFADLLRDVIGDLGTIYRYGGDEFSLFFSGIEVDTVNLLLEEIMKRANGFYHVGEVISITASMGAVFAEHGKCSEVSFNAFINYADNALYIAKNEGKNSYKRVIM